MSDLSAGGAPATIPDPAAAAAAPPAGAPATPAVDPFDNAEVQTFDRKYVEKLRQEAAGHRTKAQETAAAKARYDEAFGGWGDDDASVLLDVLKLAATDPVQGAAAMKEIAALLAGDITETPGTPSAPAQGTALTQEDLERILTDRESKKNLDVAVQGVEREAESLGYKKGTAEYFELLWRTQNETSFDMQAAHTAMQAKTQAAIDAYVASKAAEALNNAGGAPSGGAAPSGATPITTSRQAHDSAKARLAALRGKG